MKHIPGFSPIAPRTSAVPASGQDAGQIHVWDLLVRIFHWSMVASFSVAYLTEDDFLSLHVAAGYTILGLILVRLVWGFIGSRHARWSDFVKSPSEIAAYLRDVMRFRAHRYIGHNPAGGAMVLALMVSLIMTVLTGLAVYGGQELSGPLASLLSDIPDSRAHQLEDVHEVFANLTLLLVVLHLVGVVFASLQHHENLIRSMITGFKKRDSK